MFSDSFSSVYYNPELSPVLALSKEGYKNIKLASNSSEIVIFILLFVLIKYVISTETPYLDKIFIENLMIRVKNTVKFYHVGMNSFFQL